MGVRVVGVVGHPIAHSLSPAIHNAALRHAGRADVYLAFEVPPDGFAPLVDGLRAAYARGLNVTLPHKGAAYEYAERRAEESEHTRAVNTLVFEGGAAVGHNTDVAGIRGSLEELGVDVSDMSVLIIGAGGAGRAAAWATRDAAELTIVNRTQERAETVGGLVASARVAPWGGLSSVARSVDVIVNATSVGLEGDDSVLDAATLEAAAERCRLVLDLVYSPNETALVRAARAAGINAADGLGVLVQQAARAYELFWDSAPDLDVMRAAAVRAAGRTT